MYIHSMFACCSCCMPILFRHWPHILHGRWWILAKDVRFICWHYWTGRYCTHGNYFSNIYLWTWKVWQCKKKQEYLIIATYFETISFLLSLHRFTEDIYQMTGIRPGLYWQWTWRYIGPIIMIAILISSVVCMIIETPSYNAYNKETVWMIPDCTLPWLY